MSALTTARRCALLFPSRRGELSEGVLFSVSEITVAALSGKTVTFERMQKRSQVAGFCRRGAGIYQKQHLTSTLAWNNRKNSFCFHCEPFKMAPSQPVSIPLTPHHAWSEWSCKWMFYVKNAPFQSVRYMLDGWMVSRIQSGAVSGE